MTSPITTPPEWLTDLLEFGCVPYIATSRKLIPHLNTVPFGLNVKTYLMDEAADAPFMEAYLLSNSLSFESPNLKMPHWVLIDAALMQTAVVGFAMPINAVPEELLHFYREDNNIDFSKLTHIPVSGQICSTNIDQKSLTGISLFSLGKHFEGIGKLGLLTKTLALEVYRARSYDFYYGIAQYDNPSLRVHGRFTQEMEIHQPIVLLHPGKERTFIYKMKLDYDPIYPDKSQDASPPSYWMSATDNDKKHAMIEGMKNGKRYIIAPPFWVQRSDGIFLPIIEKDA